MIEAGEVIVIGGGIAGCSTAFYLAADGVGVTLLEQYEPGTLASGANAGSLHAQMPPEAFLTKGRDWAEAFAPALPLFVESMALWRAASATVAANLEVFQTGGLVAAASSAEMRTLEAKCAYDRAAGLDMELLDRNGLQRRAPCVSEHMIGGIFCPVEGKANPLVAAPVFADAARQLGARFRTGCRVTGIRRSRGFFEVETSRGCHRARRVVNAAGTGAGPVAKLAGGGIDYQPFVQQLIVTERTAPLIGCLIYAATERLSLKQASVGTVVIGGGWPGAGDARGYARVLNASLAGNLRVALEVVPALRPLRVVRTWAAAVNGSADWRPLLGEMPGVPGLFVNWVPWMGFSGALAASRIVASQVQGRTPPVDFDVAHFAP